jgi:hypothetical protein
MSFDEISIDQRFHKHIIGKNGQNGEFQISCAVKPAHEVTSIKQSLVLKGHLCCHRKFHIY